MKTKSIQKTAIIAFMILALATALGWAAKAPISKDDLKKEATHIVTGTVLDASSAIEPSKFEKGFGNMDQVFTLKVKMEAIEKGGGIRIDDEIVIVAWKAHTRIGPAKIARQGHESIPQKGQKATFFLKLDGKTYTPLMPNGVAIAAPEKQPDEKNAD